MCFVFSIQCGPSLSWLFHNCSKERKIAIETLREKSVSTKVFIAMEGALISTDKVEEKKRQEEERKKGQSVRLNQTAVPSS